jgi:transcriptional regulator
MFVQRHFAKDDRTQLFEFIDATAAGTLITAGAAGLVANTVPLLRQPKADRLWGHLARGNPQLRDMADVGEALVVFNGPHGYISPNWYTDPQQVPTWNFVSVQVRGRLQLYEDREAIRDILRRLTEKHEAGFRVPWTMEKMDPDRLDRMLRAVVGFHLEIDEIQGKYKLSQNRDASDRAGAIAGLEATGNTELAALMRQQEEE